MGQAVLSIRPMTLRHPVHDLENLGPRGVIIERACHEPVRALRVGHALNGQPVSPLRSPFHERGAVLWLMLVLTLLAVVVAIGLRETAPRVLERRGNFR
jgi:hypothetical protein